MKGGTTGSTISTHRSPLDATIASLRFSGLWVTYDKKVSAWERVYKIYNKSVLVILCVFAATVLGDVCLMHDDLVVLTDDGCILAGISVIIFKVFNFHIRSERIKSLIAAVHDPVVTLNRSSDKRVRQLVEACSFYEKMLLHGFWAVGATLSAALIVLVPVKDGGLPIRARYPFDVGSFPMQQIAFCLQACAVSIGLISIIGMDTIVIGLYKWTNVQLVVLNANYENCLKTKSRRATLLVELHQTHIIKETARESSVDDSNDDITCFIPFNDSEARVTSDDSFERRFRTCIQHHQRLISCVDEMNDIFGVSMLVQLFASFSMICFTGFQAVSGAKNLSTILKFGVYLGAAFSQLLNWCWNGNALKYQSASLATSQWLSGWENEYSRQVVSLMIISLMYSKRPLGLKAGKFYTMSMETFITILRSSYSFFTLLTKVNDAKSNYELDTELSASA